MAAPSDTLRIKAHSNALEIASSLPQLNDATGGGRASFARDPNTFGSQPADPQMVGAAIATADRPLVHVDAQPPSDIKDQFLFRHATEIRNVDWQLHTALGYQQLNGSSIFDAVGSGELPNVELLGVSGLSSSANAQLRWTFGWPGHLNAGNGSIDLGLTRIAGVGVRPLLGQNWGVGVQTWQVENERDEIDRSVAAAVTHQTTDSAAVRHSFFGMLDDNHRMVFRVDGGIDASTSQHKYGFYWFDPNTQWAGAALAGDRKGAYWRSRLFMDDLELSSGLETELTNVRRDLTRPQRRSTRMFATMENGASSGLLWAGRIRVEHQSVHVENRGETERLVRLDTDLEKRVFGYLSRIRFLWNGHSRAEDRNSELELGWQQNWPSWSMGSIKSQVNLTHRDLNGTMALKTKAKLEIAKEISRATQFSAAFAYTLDTDHLANQVGSADWCRTRRGECMGGEVWLRLVSSL